MAYPEYLYHYTSIETFALIMSSRKIRFNCLKYVDDPEENMSSDKKEIGKLCVVSCWTDIEEDSLPMWNMYTPNMKGVKIKMKSFPFKRYPSTMKNSWKQVDSNGCLIEYPGVEKYLNDYASYIDEKKVIRENRAFVIPPAPELIAVEYTNDEDLIKPQIVYGDSFDITGIGKYKRACWEFQSEWRYRIIFTTFNAEKLRNNKKTNDLFSIRKIPYKEYFLELAENAFEGMEITLGPKASKAEKIIVESLVEKYKGDYHIKIKNSSLHIR